jgi:hypothetical protein
VNTAADPRQTRRCRCRNACGVPEDRTEQQCIRSERRHDRVEAHPTDEETVDEAGDDRRSNRNPNRRPEPAVHARRVLGHDYDVEREPAGNRQVDPALHDDERLTQAGDRQRRRERKHRQERSASDARRRNELAEEKEQPRRRHDRREAARKCVPRPAWDNCFRLCLTHCACVRAHVAREITPVGCCSQVPIRNSPSACRAKPVRDLKIAKNLVLTGHSWYSGP